MLVAMQSIYTSAAQLHQGLCTSQLTAQYDLLTLRLQTLIQLSINHLWI